jgi:hypothetical protein
MGIGVFSINPQRSTAIRKLRVPAVEPAVAMRFVHEMFYMGSQRDARRS